MSTRLHENASPIIIFIVGVYQQSDKPWIKILSFILRNFVTTSVNYLLVGDEYFVNGKRIYTEQIRENP